jgi:endonuclease-3 related protein
MNEVELFYFELLSEYKHQGWWPLLECKGTNPTKTGSFMGYHPLDYSYPKSERQVFEICVGAILTQNTAWPNVESALLNLDRLKAFSPGKLLSLEEADLKAAIRPAGYFNQKARKLVEFSSFFLSLKGRIPSREELLSVWGVGQETADSILLYAYKKPEFVVDSYTRQVCSSLGWFEKDAPYSEVKSFFESNLERDFRLYQEFHALIVEHAKRKIYN